MPETHPSELVAEGSSSSSPRFLNLALSIASGILLAFSFPFHFEPFGLNISFHLSFLSFFALVPLLACIDNHQVTLGRVGGYCFLMGIVSNGLLIYWLGLMTEFSYLAIPAYLIVCLILVFYLLIFGLITFIINRKSRLPLYVVVPCVWVSVEFLRSKGDLGFTWGQMGYALTNHPLLIQFADVTGVYGVSFWLVLINCLIFEVIKRVRAKGREGGSSIGCKVPILCIVMLITLPLVYGIWNQHAVISFPKENIKVALIQPNIPQNIKFDEKFSERIKSTLERLTQYSVEQGVDLVVWPETAIPFPGIHRKITKSGRGLWLGENYIWMRTIGSKYKVPLIFGTEYFEWYDKDKFRAYNSAFLLNEKGELQEQGFQKTRLVPITEKIPYASVLGFLGKLSEWKGIFTPGKELTLFRSGKAKFGMLICYESTFTEPARGYKTKGANLLVNISNDAWFGKTSAPYQHVAMAVLRAIENRITVIRSANTGISCVIDPLGRFQESKIIYTSPSPRLNDIRRERGKRTKIFTEAILIGKVALMRKGSIYSKIGDLVAYISLMFSLTALFLSAARRFARRS